MGEILSQDEVNALLQAVDDGGLSAGGGAPGEGGRGGIRTVNLTRLQWSVEGRLPGLRPLVDRLARSLRTSFATFFGQLPEVTARGAEMLRYETMLARLEPPVSLQLFRMTPLRGQGMLVVSPALVGAFLQVVFGGDPGRATPVPAREFSTIELRALERLGSRVLGDLRDAFAPLEPIEFSFVRSEANPQFAAVAGPQDLMLVIELGVAVNGCDDGRIRVHLPYASLEPVRARLQATTESAPPLADADWAARIRANVAEAEVEVSAELGRHRMSMRDVLAMAVGDVVPLGTGREGPVLVRVAGRPHFLGAPGIAGGRNAVRITQAI
jgi:flagellar motor switch protein FliM